MNEQLVKLIDKHSYDGTLYSFGHIIYKETVCGPWVTFILSDGSEVHYYLYGKRGPLAGP